MQPRPVLRGCQLIIGSAGHDRHAKRRDRLLVENGAKRAGTEKIRLQSENLVGRHDRAARCVGKLLSLRSIDVGDRQPGTLRGGVHCNARRDAARALKRNVETLNAVLVEGAANCRLYAEKYAERGMRARIAPNVPAFDWETGPLAILLGILLMVGPLLSWRQERRPVLRKLALPALFAATALAIAFLALPQATILAKFGLALAAGLIPAAVLPLIGRNPLRTPLAIWGMAIAHLGAGVAVAGMAADSAFTVEKLTASRPGETVEVGPWLVRFEAVAPVAGPNWTAVEAELRASRGGGVHILRPQSRFFTSPPTETNEAAIKTLLSGQLYTVLGQEDAEGRWQLRLWWKPLVTLIWFGGILVGIGGLLAFIGHARRAWRRRVLP